MGTRYHKISSLNLTEQQKYFSPHPRYWSKKKKQYIQIFPYCKFSSTRDGKLNIWLLLLLKNIW